MNDNTKPDPREALIGRVLAFGVVTEIHLTDRLQELLRNLGVPDAAREAVREYLAPVVASISEIEGDVIRGARAIPTPVANPDLFVFNALLGRMQAFGEEFAKQAGTPEQAALAAKYRDFMRGVADAWGNSPGPIDSRPKDRDRGLGR